MNRPGNRVWASLALLSIIAPVGLLATFRLTGVLREPPKPETITAETVTWKMSRPTRIVTIDERAKNHFTDGKAWIGLDVHVSGYIENKVNWPSDGDDDVMDFRITASANVSDGSIYSLAVRFSRPDSFAKVNIEEHSSSMDLRNLETRHISNLGTIDLEASFEATAVNQPKDTSLSIVAYWTFIDENNIDHFVTIDVEATCFDGTAYRKVIIPVVLEVLVG